MFSRCFCSCFLISSLFFYMKGFFHYIALHCLIPSSTCLSSSMALWVSIPFLTAFDFLGIKIPFNTVQGSSPHKSGQKSNCSALNAVVTAFLFDIYAFLSSSYTLKVHSYRWKFLEGRLSYLSTRLTNIHLIRVV